MTMNILPAHINISAFVIFGIRFHDKKWINDENKKKCQKVKKLKLIYKRSKSL